MLSSSCSRNTRTPVRSRKTLFAIGFICLAPLIAACLLYFSPSATRDRVHTASYGTLIRPQRPIPATLMVNTENRQNVPLQSFKGSWLLLSVDTNTCLASCVEKLYFMRQIRAAQGAQRTRIVTVWLRTENGKLPKALSNDYRDTRFLVARAAALRAWLPSEAGTTLYDHLYLVDPNGNLMMRFPQNPNPGKIRADIAKLLKWSGLG